MPKDEQEIETGSELDLAIERALAAANFRAGAATDAATSFVVEVSEPSAAEAGDIDGPDGDL
ncbi:hypothetical protein ACH3VR_09545 [Microbacterium sp. B2969]|uniref:Uncharacterized protein n=1 Tax=Microbacterium alkaliflavum TaxID=3248839 RepID=A0ABW7Q874_9MICO